MDRILIDDLRVLTVVGALPHERETAQPVRIDLSVGLDLRDGTAVPHLLYFAYQGTFAVITAALISGAIVERMRGAKGRHSPADIRERMQRTMQQRCAGQGQRRCDQDHKPRGCQKLLPSCSSDRREYDAAPPARIHASGLRAL